ncbi:uncharacterized protein LOC119674240 [Teleopsis dalmanni]|uniref:uncharacterized protein LOC119674240 n=1 Tax=Teleopsis dalmanni TaxID=139649 RepID=UPI0018CE62BB|nr:uncharacterized protein LOC119674240 [Teleopsis dalmanni]
MKFTKIEVTGDSSYISNVTYWIDNGTANADMYVKRTLNYGLRVFVDLQMKLADSKKYQSLFSYDVDVCKLLNEFFRESLLRSWYRNLLKYSNFMENCPIMEGFYYIRKLALEPNSIPPYLRSGDYRLCCTAYYGKRNSKKQRSVSNLTAYMQILS